MNKMKLITECSYEVELIEEGEKGKDLFVVGIFSSAEKKNANGRIYKKDTLNREVTRLQESYLKKGIPLWGELGHPANPEPNLDKVAIRTVQLEWKGDDLYGKAKILDTPTGNIAKTLLREGPIGISSRGLGSVDESGYVNDEYKLLLWDLVSSPSNNPSWVKGIYEGTEFVVYDVKETKPEPNIEVIRNEYFNFLLKEIDSLCESNTDVTKSLAKVIDKFDLYFPLKNMDKVMKESGDRIKYATLVEARDLLEKAYSKISKVIGK